MRVAGLISSVVLALIAGPGLAYDACAVPEGFGLSQNDQSRLENLDTSRTRGLGNAMRGESSAERAAVAALFEPGLSYINPDLLAGQYKCRTIKLGGNLPLVVYGWFKCEIVRAEGDFVIRKLTGSQNFSGVLAPAGAGYAYKGASFYGWEGAGRLYGDDPERDQAGCLSAVTKESRHFLLELPFPKLESFHDLIEFVPAN